MHQDHAAGFAAPLAVRQKESDMTLVENDTIAASPFTQHGSTIGSPISRVDGKLKVTGAARYAAEAPIANATHAIMVQSTIASGSISEIDTREAERAPGVLLVLTPKNMIKLKSPGGMSGDERLPLSDMKIHYFGQTVAVVVADTIERARSAAALVNVTYAAEKPVVELADPVAKVEHPKASFSGPLQSTRGNVAQAKSPDHTVIDAVYNTPTETHNPMEMSATVANWDAPDHLTVWDATQGVAGSAQNLAKAFGLGQKDVRLICLYVGGGFGCKGAGWPHTLLAAAAAKILMRPVKLMLTRAQMFTSCGHRPQIQQKLTVAATKDGKLVSIEHHTLMHGSPTGSFVEPAGNASSKILYACPNLDITHEVHIANIAPATFMRAPGENPGIYALESAMDELAVALNIDPLELRRINHADTDPDTSLPWSSKHLKDCYTLGAEKFGWSKRSATPGTMKTPEGHLIGWGMATASYPAHRFPNQARIRLYPMAYGKIRAVGASATQDLGTGAYTVFTQMTGALTGLPLAQAKFELGDSLLPPGGVSGGSATTGGIAIALTDAATDLKTNLLKLADVTSLAGLTADEVRLQDGFLVAANDPSVKVPIHQLIVDSQKPFVEGISPPASQNQHGPKPPIRKGTVQQTLEDYDANLRKYTFQSFGVHFVEVTVEQPVPRVRVNRVVSVMDAGTIVNPKTARSQIMGGVIMGIGQALMEETIYDPNTGRPVTDSLADYPVCVNPDVNELDVHFIGIPDLRFNAVGCRGIGEIGITGIAAAIANAVYNAAGKRVRDLPITPDKLL
jgi:xanthine dehydrogenase YagR molybdenum-binding subunit